MKMQKQLNILKVIAALPLITNALCAYSEPLALKAVALEDTVEVYAGDNLFTSYKFGDDTQKYPYFYPVNGPASGSPVTTESTTPYPHHHSLFFGCDRVNGGNYWQDTLEAGRIVSTAVRVVEAEGSRVVFENDCEWRKPGEAPVLQDRRVIHVSAPNASLRVIDFEITLTPLTDVYVEKTNHSLFAARMKPEMNVASGGVLVNAEGDLAEAGTFGKASPWCDFSGKNGEVTEGLAIFQHPGNPLYPVKWFTRDYGFFSPTPLYWPPDGKGVTLEKGASVTLRYRVIVHEGTAAEAGIQTLFEAYASGAGQSNPSE